MLRKSVCYVGVHGKKVGFPSIKAARRYIVQEFRAGRRLGGGNILKNTTGSEIYGMVEYCEPYD